jgi:hypothetical protein
MILHSEPFEAPSLNTIIQTLPESRSLPSVLDTQQRLFYTRQRILGKYFIGKGFFAEYFFRTLGKDFVECRKTLGKLRIEKNKKTDFFKL